MRNILALLIVVGLAIGAIIPVQASSYAQEVVTITYQTWPDVGMETVEDQIALFESLYPNIKVKVITVPFYEYFQHLLISLAGDAGPDVIQMHPYWIGDLIERGALLDLAPYIQEDEQAQEAVAGLLPGVLDLYSEEGKIYGLPRDIGLVAFVVNKDMMSAAGLEYPDLEQWDWNMFAEYAAAMTHEDEEGRPVWGARIQYWYQEGYSSWYLSNGGSMVNDEGDGCGLESEEVVEAFQFLRDMVDAGIMSPVTAEGLGYLEGFLDQRVAMQLCGSWNMDTITQNATFDWDVIPFPASPRTGMATPILSVIPYSVNARSKHLDEAVTFALWSMGEDAATILARNGQGIPTQAEIAPIFFETVPAEHKLVYLDVANARGDWEVVRTVPTGEWHDQTVNNITQFVFWDAEEYSVEEALKKVCVEMNAIFDLYD